MSTYKILSITDLSGIRVTVRPCTYNDEPHIALAWPVEEAEEERWHLTLLDCTDAETAYMGIGTWLAEQDRQETEGQG